MKRILIFQENTSAVEVYDDDETDLGDYTKNLSQILENANVTILQTSESSVILRPSKVTSILVNPMIDPQDPQPQDQKQIQKQLKKKKSKKVKQAENEDIITDR